ncbi:uncharacterized protein (TIGR02284 family) [Variovorax boronicumulans]|uniref:PA2169 family four-helix-bundle protein n=1 Tax=Variovorax boronicumulans TaxID=436515 RepID=UPI0027888A1E|nr:PA2169 family four-helix-bundle protein [Variovorax boronicumulans]MDP9920747.1 uncharacterized protein (TIGR02284 family) [Variovorax boronicumulans]
MAKDQNPFPADDLARDSLPGDVLSTDSVVHVLNHLLAGARDDAHAFRVYTDEVKAHRLKEVFASRAAQCQAAASQLVELVITCGGQPAGGGTALGAVHRGWAHVKAAMGAASESSVLDACARADDAAVARYREALALRLPMGIRQILQMQAHDAQRGHAQVRLLRNTLRACRQSQL